MSVLHQRLYDAYYTARQKKRKKPEVIAFEINYEKQLYDLYHEIITQSYQPKPANVFVTHKPVDREIFAPQFRDRVIHHLIYQYIYPQLDKKFIYDSYSCREGKGTHFGIKRAKTFLRKVSHNYTRDAYVLKLDVKGYFMNINRQLLLDMVEDMLDYDALNITQTEKNALQYLLRVVIMHNVSTHALRQSPMRYWKNIPASKSLFCTHPDCGLPIGALTSQLLSNVYLNEIDHQIKGMFRYYGRYVDDLLLLDTDKSKLQNAIVDIDHLLQKIGLSVHPHKIYLQHYAKGFYFLGHYIKPGTEYISRRIKKHIYLYVLSFLEQWEDAAGTPTIQQLQDWESRFNSYFGVLSKANTYNYVHRLVDKLPPKLLEYADFEFVEEDNQMRMRVKPLYRVKNNYAPQDDVYANL